MSVEYAGWLLDLYAGARGAVLWLIGEDGARVQLTQDLPLTAYLAGPPEVLAEAYAAVQHTPRVAAHITQRPELYRGMLDVLALTTENQTSLHQQVRALKRRFPLLEIFDLHIPLSVRYAARYGVYPLTRCRMRLDEEGQVSAVTPLEAPGDLPEMRGAPLLPPLRVLRLGLQNDDLWVSTEDESTRYPMSAPEALMAGVSNWLADHDPDILLTEGGDERILPWLLAQSRKHGGLSLNRDAPRSVRHKEALTFHSYGRIHHRGAQIHLYGRVHLDAGNTSMGGSFSLYAAVEIARMTGLGLQTAARNSPGAGFTARQITEALRRGLLVPENKSQVEAFRSAMDFNLGDRGGLNYRPVQGVHANVAELDFFSMYPSIIAAWNISGETIGRRGKRTRIIPQTEIPITQDAPGLVAAVIAPILARRRRIKERIRQMEAHDPQRERLKAMADALKWLGYVSFGYQGFKNNRFGSSAAHEAITAVGRWTLLKTIHTAQQHGYEVLYANTDSIFVQSPERITAARLAPLMRTINARTGLHIELEGIFDWIVFPPAHTNEHIAASNRYFGRFRDGELKVRGTAQRKADSPAWIVEAELALLDLLATRTRPKDLPALGTEATALLDEAIRRLEREEVPLEALVSQKRLSREMELYKGESEAAMAAGQLKRAGLPAPVGKRIGVIFTHGGRRKVLAWDAPPRPTWAQVNKTRYRELLWQAVQDIFWTMGIQQESFEAARLLPEKRAAGALAKDHEVG